MTFACAACGWSCDRAGFCARDGSPLVETHDPVIGVELGRHRVVRLIAQGGMGRVYLGLHPEIGSRVAIKVLDEQCARTPDLLERFFAEARAVNLIRHEHIVSVIDLARLPDGRPYIIMEYIDGQTLAALVRGGDAPLGGVVQVMLEMLSALAAAHKIGIVHRDLKPDNVLVTAEGHAKVADFGIAKLAPELSHDRSPRTRTGALLGTPAYMAPEQISGGLIDARTDLYAAGVVLFQAVTGRVPFEGHNLFELMRLHLETAPPSPRQLRADLPASLEHVILTALAKDPAHRFGSADAMAEALREAATHLPPGAWRTLSPRSTPVAAARVVTARSSSTPAPPPTHGAPTPVPSPGSATPHHGPSLAARHAPRAPRRHLALVAAIAGSTAAAVAVTLLVVRDDTTRAPAAPAEGSAAAPSASVASSTAPPARPSTAPPPESPSTAPALPSTTVATPPAAEPPASRPPVPRDPPPRGVRSDGSRPSPGPRSSDAAAGSGKPAAATEEPVVGPSVVIAPRGKQPASLRAPADYHPKQFDPVTYLPRALAVARRLVPDARLTSFEFYPVTSTGRVDLTAAGHSAEYNFRSPSQSERPAGTARNVAVELPCRILVELEPTEIKARVIVTDDCDARLVRHPRCSFAGVWKQAIASGVAPDLVAKISWLFDEQWFFDSDTEGSGGVATLPDRCP